MYSTLVKTTFATLLFTTSVYGTQYPNCPNSVNLGDGKCHSSLNIAECGYDDGDCCTATCTGPNCGVFWQYDCKNPSINQYAPECETNFLVIGDSYCHASSNNGECGYDGGDCCESTCTGKHCGSWGYHCKDPVAICEEDKNLIGDGKCHTSTNIAQCNYDGGDCCKETCDGPNCGKFWEYDCKNPKINIYAPECTEANFEVIGNGLCDACANSAECGYDGGDCCESTCIGEDCGQWGWHCKDPTDKESYKPTSGPTNSPTYPESPDSPEESQDSNEVPK